MIIYHRWNTRKCKNVPKKTVRKNVDRSNILLFKAMLKDIRLANNNDQIKSEIDIAYEYASRLQYNNIDKIVHDISRLNLVQINNAHHGNILEFENLIIHNICKQTVKA